MCTLYEAHCCSWYVGSYESGHMKTRNTAGQGRRWQWLVALADGAMWLELRCILERETLALWWIEGAVMRGQDPSWLPPELLCAEKRVFLESWLGVINNSCLGRCDTGDAVRQLNHSQLTQWIITQEALFSTQKHQCCQSCSSRHFVETHIRCPKSRCLAIKWESRRNKYGKALNL